MRRISWLLLVLAGFTACGGPDADPLDVAERFHEARVAGDDRSLHALLSDADRAAVPFEAFPADLPGGLALKLLGWAEARLDSASLLRTERDTAAVVLHVAGGARDTLRLVATNDPRRIWRFELDRPRWRVAIGLSERALLDSLATAMGGGDGKDRPTPETVAAAEAYLAAAERYPDMTRPVDVDGARSLVRNAAILEAMEITLRIDRSFTGSRFIGGEIVNPTDRRIATLRLVVRDADGAQERVELWEIQPRSTTPIRQLSSLRLGPATVAVDRIQVF